MKRNHWGELKEEKDEEKLAKINDYDSKIIFEKRSELKILKSSVFLEDKQRTMFIKIHKNSSVNLVVGLKQKEELIQQLIDTSQCNSMSFHQMVPTLKEVLPILNNYKVTTPRYNCFISSSQSDFVKGRQAKQVPKINKACVSLGMKKSICGLARSSDFSDITSSALTLLTDTLDHFYKSMMEEIVNVITNENRETETDIDLLTFEKAYFHLMNDSSASLLLNYAANVFNKHRQTALDLNEKVGELKSIVESHQGLFNNNMSSSEFSSHFFVKQEQDIKQEMEDYE